MTNSMIDLLAVPDHRRTPLEALLGRLREAAHVALTTHVNADGDGAGSEAALAGWLQARGTAVTIANPTPFPDDFRYMLPDGAEVPDPGAAMDGRVREADLLLVVDTGEPGRIGRVAKLIREDAVAVLDHHPPSDDGIPGPGVRDPSACATGELVFDLFAVAGEEEWNESMVQGVYAAIETDTGSFRFSNTTPRTHAIAADLIRRGIDPEAVYRRLHATISMDRIRMLRAALEGIETDPDLPITWVRVPTEVTHEMGATADDLDGLLGYARNVKGTEVAVIFRQTQDGATKVSLRSNGEVDVNRIARQFGGGGHVKAAGALVGAPPDDVVPRVLDAVRSAVAARDGEVEA
ncbi:MAG: bifunctional oligoribonuclease/PAP phosphatase NrnA [Longimicrobiales bacterium]|nr:bifunctional oligoribonuclease/PAP phosphatase NrnA [Longimicrobiales bacterium]